MATVKESAQLYEAPQSKNIADLDKVKVDLDLFEGRGKDNEGKEFTYKFIEVNGERYRVPGSVLGGLKAVLKKIPNLKYFSVIKDGAGMATRYQVIPMQDVEVQQVVQEGGV